MLTNDIVDKGVFDIAKYELVSMNYLANNLTLVFRIPSESVELLFHLQNIISFNGDLSETSYRLFRIDSDGSSYGFDVAIRLQRPELKNYMVLYFFKEKHSVPIFRALSSKLEIIGTLPALA